jgi:hypothetical protein
MTDAMAPREQVRERLLAALRDLDDSVSVDDVLAALTEALMTAVVKSAPSQADAAVAIDDISRWLRQALPGAWQIRERHRRPR